jgi:hypothetical protein
MNTPDLSHEERKALPVHHEVWAKVKAAKRPTEHLWQTTHRLLLAALAAEARESAEDRAS